MQYVRKEYLNLNCMFDCLFVYVLTQNTTGANKRKFSQIGPAVPEEIGHIQTNTQTSCCYIIREKIQSYLLKT